MKTEQWVAGIGLYKGQECFVVGLLGTKKLVAVLGLIGAADETESIANSYLIQAAPKMQAALQAIVQYRTPLPAGLLGEARAAIDLSLGATEPPEDRVGPFHTMDQALKNAMPADAVIASVSNMQPAVQVGPKTIEELAKSMGMGFYKHRSDLSDYSVTFTRDNLQKFCAAILAANSFQVDRPNHAIPPNPDCPEF